MRERRGVKTRGEERRGEERRGERLEYITVRKCNEKDPEN